MPIDEDKIYTGSVKAVKLVHIAAIVARANAFTGMAEHHAGTVFRMGLSNRVLRFGEQNCAP